MEAPLTNRFLSTLPPAYRKSLMDRMVPVAMPRRMSVYQPGEVPRFSYFVTSGLVSVVSNLEDGTMTEIEVVGAEGISPWLQLLGNLSVNSSCFMQVAGTALRLPFAEMREEFENNIDMRRSVLAFAEHQALVMGQLAACNRRHIVDQRLARWLLMVQDRVQTEELALTQEFLAAMLGSRRTSVALAAGEMQKAGLIRYRRGKVKIIDHAGLVKRACECYTVMQGLMNGLYK
ncbi:putative transcriptional regulator, Crp/Fnr family [Terriglobus saanensis SP1PR4]|uniref:Putative transcriptional regulator, Crp/Fnr family n=1 Tax=Terriglobus saanensis (strain ATCC BAA-1853 / DSM 23119 / SP1PR4) TaxID=401053 RepID=E8V1J4_TERSS|nr:putative transcriptional regulator, Crp/Fnr family [Terriglobus saanensis SP1PR4]